MVSENVKLTTLQEVAKVFDGHELHSLNFPVKGAVASLCRSHLPGEE